MSVICSLWWEYRHLEGAAEGRHSGTCNPTPIPLFAMSPFKGSTERTGPQFSSFLPFNPLA